MNENFGQSYHDNLDENIQLSKAIAKLEEMVSKEKTEKELIKKIYENLKVDHEKRRKECNDLNEKFIQAITLKKQSEDKYENELSRLKEYYEKKLDIHKQQILKLSATDPETIRNKIVYDIELQNRNILEQRQNEIDNLNDLNFEMKRKFELLNTEHETLKTEISREINHLNERHKNEVRELMFEIQLLNEKCDSAIDRDTYKNIKLELDTYKKQFSDMQNEISSLRKEKDSLLMERNETRLNLMKEMDQEKIKNKLMSNDYEKISQLNKNVEHELIMIKEKLEAKNEEIKSLTNEKFSLTRELRDKDTQYNHIIAEVRVLKQKMDERDNELEDNLKFTHEREKQRFIQDKQEKEELQKKLEELNQSLKENQSEFKNYYESTQGELHVCKRDYFIIQEEKRMMIRSISNLQQELEYIRDDYEKKSKTSDYLEKEFANLQDKYRDLTQKENENNRNLGNLEKIFNEKQIEYEKQTKILNETINSLKEDNAKIKLEDQKQLELLKTKNREYKKKIKISNSNIMSILNKISGRKEIIEEDYQ